MTKIVTPVKKPRSKECKMSKNKKIKCRKTRITQLK
jgi:hypothetical protein